MFLEECKTHFNTDCLYELLGVKKDCDEKALKKGYYRQSMRWHPDKSNLVEEDMQTYTTKFQLLNKAYQILSDEEKRKIYDETGSVDDEAGELNEDALKAWRMIFKKVTKEDIDSFMKTYQGSREQKDELVVHYEKFNGDIAKIREYAIGFDGVEELKEALDKLIDDGEIEKTKKYETSTSDKKMKAYKRKAEKEAIEVENMTQNNSDLVALIQGRQKERGTSFLDSLAAKYAPSSSKKAKRQ
ncbi:J domain-containing protein [Caenorhabditis elegans]|uniref:J domain-containing protein n=1 Tax=Caenorhabditis elegans TaxID=6239 RepID=Q22751_CAEEL|nr:J domain-containing protein [Caenorhabditis elegans]CAA90945.1 J domain-containing protein [Caenorhabditis elegans]|eukprot:NP_495944.1 DNaJ domain (prokaryotic heat shock protein) [Caenorhabditis elegans]